MNKYIYAYNLEDAKGKAIEVRKNNFKIVGIEAEWGEKDLSDAIECDECLSHHGNKSNNSPPCTRWDLYSKYKDRTAFIFSHFDLDSIFGCWILEGRMEDNEFNRKITDYIGFIDMKGAYYAHMHPDYQTLDIVKFNLSQQLKKLKKEKLEANVLLEKFYSYYKQIKHKKTDILYEDYKNQELHAYNALDKNLSIQNKLHVFISYTNYINKYCVMYNDWHSISEVNVLYNSLSKRVSIAIKDEETAKKLFGSEGVLGILRRYFGDESGGRVTVGGSPKNKQVDFSNFIKFIQEVRRKVNEETL